MNESIRPSRPLRRAWLGSAAVGLGLALSGCAPTSHYASATAQLLQQRVLGVAVSAQAHQYAGALRQLDQVEVADDQALSNGTITRARHDAIVASIVQVRADLAALEAAAKVSGTPSPPKEHGHGNGGGDGGDGNGGGGD
ncbi:MAG: hypothetical protein ACTHJM_07525 [Marmoricola sp.]